MRPDRPLIVQALLDPESATRLSGLQWDLLIRQGRRANLLARLARSLRRHGIWESVPNAARMHLLSAQRMAERQDLALRWEVECVRKALAETGVRVILLKGAAYVIAGLPTAQGRMFTDIDILVPKARLGEVESALMLNGWQGTGHDAYDQRYYRRWMHEIPPMRHVRRGTTIDVHHTILPETARVKVNTPALLAGIVPVAGEQNLFVLQPVDMLLHSATHLFHEGEFASGLRDLFDLDGLLQGFGATPTFWERLVPRAVELGLTRPLYYALRFTTTMLDTPVPRAVVDAAAVGRPPLPLARLMDECYWRALQPLHASTNPPGTRLARFLLYVRSHWIRMPFPLLAYHLGRKVFVRHPVSDAPDVQIADADRQA